MRVVSPFAKATGDLRPPYAKASAFAEATVDKSGDLRLVKVLASCPMQEWSAIVGRKLCPLTDAQLSLFSLAK